MKTKKSRTILSAIKKKKNSDERRFLSVPLGGAAGAGADIKQQQQQKNSYENSVWMDFLFFK